MKNPNANVVLAIIINKTNVPADLRSSVSVVIVVKVVIEVKAKCIVDFFNVLRSIIINKTNVPADLHELLSTAKNLPEYNIRIFDPLKIPLI